jgi:hypothetical protein
LLREKAVMERAGRGAFEAGAFSGEMERWVARVAVEGVFRWEDEEWSEERGEVVVRREADRRSVEPSSVTEVEMLCRDDDLRWWRW